MFISFNKINKKDNFYKYNNNSILPHSIIFGEDGGIFALLNSVNDQEEFIKQFQSDQDYWK